MKYPPVEVVEFISRKTAYSGNYGISLSEIWNEISTFLEEPIDAFLKNIIWQWVFLNEKGTPHQIGYEGLDDEQEGLNVFREDLNIPLPLIGTYDEFIASNGGNENQLRLKPTPPTQWKYLTGLVNSKRLKLQLGEFPFQLLVEIARHGSSGILAPDLSKNTNQDPRSLTPRLKKLEDLNLISKRNYYNEISKQHTNLCIHKNFVKDDVSSAIADLNENLESSRNVEKTKIYVVNAVKSAPNQLRGFADLKVELKLDKNKSSSKFFRSIIEYLDKRGYVERLMVKESDNKSLTYCIKFLKDLAKDYDERDEIADFFNELDDVDGIEDEETNPEDEPSIPSLTKHFPLQNQFFQFIQSHGTDGATSMDIVRHITGVSDCRPYTKSLDIFTSFVIDNDKLKKLKKFEDEYEDYSIVRGYDFEGKYKFYRYFTRDNYLKISKTTRADKKIKSISSKKQPKTAGIHYLNKKHYVALGKISQTSLFNNSKVSNKRKLDELHDIDQNENTKVERRGRPKRGDTRSQKVQSNKDKANGPPKDVSQVTNSDFPNASSNTNSPSVDPTEIPILVDNSLLSIDFNIQAGHELGNTNLSMGQEIEPVINSLTKDAISKSLSTARLDNSKKNSVSASVGSLKAIKRRSALIEIIKAQGGATYTAANLCRLVDEKLGNSTITDKKTLARDVSYLISIKDLDAEDITFTRSGQVVTRKLLILTDPTLRPSKEFIENIKKDCLNDNSNKQNLYTNRRVIEDEVTLYNPTPAKKKSGTRLASLKSKTKIAKIKREIDDDDDGTSISDRESELKNKKHKGSESAKKATKNGEESKSVGKGSDDAVQFYLPKRRKGRTKQNQSKIKTTNDLSTKSSVYRVRGENRFDQEQATCLYRAVIISRSFKRGPIDFEAIARLFDGMDAGEVKRKWISVRKVAGGLSAVMRGIKVFEKIVTRAIEDGNVTTSDLTEIDYEFLLSIWEDADNSILDGMDTNPFYSTIEGNLEDYEIPPYKDYQAELFEQLEENSMRQKEAILSSTTFYYSEGIEKIVPKAHDDLRSTLKATFATAEENFSKQSVNNILSEYGEENTQEAITSLLKDKEISYYSLQDSDIRFILTDKFYNLISHKVFTPKFFHQASRFESNLKAVIEARKGLILSQGISSGEIAGLLNLLICDGPPLKVTRIDKTYKFAGYESRLIDKSKLSCNIIVSSENDTRWKNLIDIIPIPTGKACSHIWLDLNGSINSALWRKIIISILYHIVFKPGVTRAALYKKMQTVLSVRDYLEVLSWLESSNVIKEGTWDSLFANNQWFSIIGN
ncbi:transcription factor tau 138 kDa subunit [[Candida] railenensis]|uniref:Transcription factor tau 138 kDa subunit n=1 Tax=[Candida] railenensis TaxID=45579 RepID=A0A9P0QN12_9ASCO|nr:transcription factor tau 138 kDa subunit [[Candida] railenensis]